MQKVFFVVSASCVLGLSARRRRDERVYEGDRLSFCMNRALRACQCESDASDSGDLAVRTNDV